MNTEASSVFNSTACYVFKNKSKTHQILRVNPLRLTDPSAVSVLHTQTHTSTQTRHTLRVSWLVTHISVIKGMLWSSINMKYMTTCSALPLEIICLKMHIIHRTNTKTDWCRSLSVHMCMFKCVYDSLSTDPCGDLQPCVQSFSQTFHSSRILISHTTHTAHFNAVTRATNFCLKSEYIPFSLISQRAASGLSKHIKLLIRMHWEREMVWLYSHAI